MISITKKQIQSYIDKRKTVTIPQIQMQFDISYEVAHEAVCNLVEDGVIRFDSDLKYNVVPKQNRILTECENTEEEKLQEARDELERRKSEILARMQQFAEADDNEAEKNDEEETVDVENKEFVSSNMIRALELGINLREKGSASICISIMQRRLGFGRQLASRIYDTMNEKGYISTDSENPRRKIVNIAQSELDRLKRQVSSEENELDSEEFDDIVLKILKTQTANKFKENRIVKSIVSPITNTLYNEIHSIFKYFNEVRIVDDHISIISDMLLIEGQKYIVNLYKTNAGYYLTDAQILMKGCLNKEQYESAIQSVDFYFVLGFYEVMVDNDTLYIAAKSIKDVCEAYVKLFAAIERAKSVI